MIGETLLELHQHGVIHRAAFRSPERNGASGAFSARNRNLRGRTDRNDWGKTIRRPAEMVQIQFTQIDVLPLRASPIHAQQHVASELMLHADVGLIAAQQRKARWVNLDSLLGDIDSGYRKWSAGRRSGGQRRGEGRQFLIDDLIE